MDLELSHAMDWSGVTAKLPVGLSVRAIDTKSLPQFPLQSVGASLDFCLHGFISVGITLLCFHREP